LAYKEKGERVGEKRSERAIIGALEALCIESAQAHSVTKAVKH